MRARGMAPLCPSQIQRPVNAALFPQHRDVTPAQNIQHCATGSRYSSTDIADATPAHRRNADHHQTANATVLKHTISTACRQLTDKRNSALHNIVYSIQLLFPDQHSNTRRGT
ncbi:hypothetical protein AAFF_G00310120 [Aldrovandia affinis]|uniref:Uncharacterized protein n=1 Tax=Aldrovandia affinis TaxID=143900 RepID=A0AAD7WRX8_9TELE|nr:hypothetical protein AAFF_G00310120 [Aldrovandia affinis]